MEEGRSVVVTESGGDGSAPAIALPLSFPRGRPQNYRQLADEPCFDAARHLAPERPARTWTLADFGYDAAAIAVAASPVAITSPFRLLSPEGVTAFRQVALALYGNRRTSNRTASYVSGSVYRSRFIRDLCNAPEIAQVMSEIAGCELVAHSMPSQQAYINFAPEDVGRAVDTWHTDGIGFDYVLMLSDPQLFEGGEFQFFQGTREEAASLLEIGVGGLVGPVTRDLPADRVVSAAFPAAGYAVFQQGTHVVHRATALRRAAERITVVPGMVTRQLSAPDPTRDVVAGWSEPGIESEYARHKAWLARSKLDGLIAALESPAQTPADLAKALREAIGDAERAATVLEALVARQAAG